MDRICHMIAAVIFTFFLALAAILVVPGFFHSQPYIVADNGMEPDLKMGGLAFAKRINGAEAAGQLQVGDIICYTAYSDAIGTKRVQVIDEQGEKLYVKNDKTGQIDEKPVPFLAVVGKVSFTIPMLGSFLLFLKTGPGIVMLCLLLAALVFAVFLPELFYVEEEDGEAAEAEEESEGEGGITVVK